MIDDILVLPEDVDKYIINKMKLGCNKLGLQPSLLAGYLGSHLFLHP